MFRNAAFILLFAITISGGAFAEPSAAPEAVTAATRKYEQAVGDAQKTYDNTVKAAHSAYIAALNKAIEAETKAGNLDRALSIRDLRDAAQKAAPPVAPSDKQAQPDDAALDVNHFLLKSAQITSSTIDSMDLRESKKEDRKGWQRVPAKLRNKRAVIYSVGKGKSVGAADFQVSKDGVILLACNFGYQGHSDGDWDKKRWTKEQFVENGWTEVTEEQLGGVLVKGDGREQTVFIKRVKRGEQFRLRCNKYDPPFVIVIQ